MFFANKILQPLFKTKCKLAKLCGTTGKEALQRALFTSSLTLFAVHSQTIVRIKLEKQPKYITITIKTKNS